VVGVNCFTETAESPLETAGNRSGEGGPHIESILRVDPAVESELRVDVETWRARRHPAPVRQALDDLKRAAEGTDNIMPATIALAHAGGTTGEWAGALRQVFGEYRAPTGVRGGVGHRGTEFRTVRSRVRAWSERAGGPPKLLVAKPGLDGHSNGAEQIAVAARDAGFEVIYQGIRLSPAEIAAAARDEDVDVVGISILSGSHLELVPEVVDRLRAAGVEAPVVVGGIIPPEDAEILLGKGVARVYTPKDFEIGPMMDDMLRLAEEYRAGAPV
jgi:(2R)-ethylmalonyl-CoA mutase